MIFGAGGLEERDDMWFGVTLMAPHVRYPNHSNDADEVYLVAAEGEFTQPGDNWFTAGVGAVLYNQPNVDHGMRSHTDPMLVFWALPLNQSH